MLNKFFLICCVKQCDCWLAQHYLFLLALCFLCILASLWHPANPCHQSLWPHLRAELVQSHHQHSSGWMPNCLVWEVILHPVHRDSRFLFMNLSWEPLDCKTDLVLLPSTSWGHTQLGWSGVMLLMTAALTRKSAHFGASHTWVCILLACLLALVFSSKSFDLSEF